MNVTIVSVIKTCIRCLGLGRNDSVVFGGVGGGFGNLVLDSCRIFVEYSAFRVFGDDLEVVVSTRFRSWQFCLFCAV